MILISDYFSGQPPDEGPNPDEDPLPNEDENNSNDGQSNNDLVTINVTNEVGQTKPHEALTNGWVQSSS